MKIRTRNILAPLSLIIICLSIFVQTGKPQPTETVTPDEVLIFLEDVVKLDLSKYNIKLSGTEVSYPLELGGICQITGKYTLQSPTNNITVLFKFRNNTLSWCLLRVNNGTSKYSTQTDDDVNHNANAFLVRYQKYKEDSEIESMRTMLEVVGTTKNTTNIRGDIKFTVSNAAEVTSFEWKQTVNDVDYPGMSITFKNGTFHSISDKRNIYVIGSTDVNITKKEAITLSVNYAKNLTWTIDGENVTEFGIVEEMTDPQLFSQGREDPLTLYPYWYVLLYLDDVYPGNIRHIQVMLWADNGEPISCQPISFGGGNLKEYTTIDETQTITEQITASLNKQSITTNHFNFVLILTIVIIALTSSMMFFHKKTKNPPVRQKHETSTQRKQINIRRK